LIFQVAAEKASKEVVEENVAAADDSKTKKKRVSVSSDQNNLPTIFIQDTFFKDECMYYDTSGDWLKRRFHFNIIISSTIFLRFIYKARVDLELLSGNQEQSKSSRRIEI
jgi:hypothetical protein